MGNRSWWLGLALCGIVCVRAASAETVAWTPNDWTKEETVKLCTNDPGEGEYCFPVWLVVIDGDVYVRLGTKASERMRKNIAGFVLPVELAGHRFEKVRATEAPDYVDRVNQAMAGKYTSDIIIHHFSHPLTMRLRPEPAAP